LRRGTNVSFANSIFSSSIGGGLENPKRVKGRDPRKKKRLGLYADGVFLLGRR
jgi:hypothetical protein